MRAGPPRPLEGARLSSQIGLQVQQGEGADCRTRVQARLPQNHPAAWACGLAGEIRTCSVRVFPSLPGTYRLFILGYSWRNKRESSHPASQASALAAFHKEGSALE